MLSLDQARTIAEQWRSRFSDEANFDLSWSRFFDMVGDPTPEKLAAWLAKDQAKDAVKSAGIVHEPLRPVRQRYSVPLGDCPRCGGDVHACAVCHGLGYVRRDLDVGHPEFGKALRCPSCLPG